MECRTGYGYCIYCPSSDEFLGRLGEFYTDVRLAQVYAEPRAAKAAIARMDHPVRLAVVQIKMEVRGVDLDKAKAEHAPETPEKKDDPKPNGTPATANKPKPTPAKAA